MSPLMAAAFVVLTTFGLVAFDIWLAKDKIVGNTYSEVIRAAGKACPWFYYLLAFTLGVLLSHWGLA